MDEITSMTGRSLIAAICMLMLATQSTMSAEPSLPAAASREIDFVRDIQPLLQSRCFSCHDGTKQRSGLRLDIKSSAFKGGESLGAAIIPGKSATSPLVRLVAGLEDGMLMPPEGDRLTTEQISVLRAWIDQGAKWPDEASAKDDVTAHWSFRPVEIRNLPEVSTDAFPWMRNPIDLFVTAKLEGSPASLPSAQNSIMKSSSQTKKLAPSPEADRTTLIRRLSFDLLGLPPTPDEVVEFTSDTHPDAYERLVDRLLASPHFGERWARHWLDVVRFAESDGFETNQPRPNAWPYRDYVIRSFNEDMPYSQFVTEQLAGDATENDAATGFIVGGAWDRVKSPDPGLTAQQRADELHDMVSTTASAFLGLTVGCARCHNHKFDPISQVDYYSLKAVFAGVQHGERPLKPPHAEGREAEIATIKAELDDIERDLWAFEPIARTTTEESKSGAPKRPAVHRRTNVDRFAPTKARFVRFTIEATSSGSQPCLDEVEIFSIEPKPQNVAASSRGTKTVSSSNLPGYEIHQLKHINDGRYGNGASWISDEPGKGWVLFEFVEAIEIDRVLWSRDRPANGMFSDRIPTQYRIEVGMSLNSMMVVATHEDRLPINSPGSPTDRVASNEAARRQLERLTSRQNTLNERLRELTSTPMVYAGRFVAPEPTHRFHRGDPLQPKEAIAPASLSAFGTSWALPVDSPDKDRRQQLARWITDPKHPLTARVFANRLWHFHFGQGLVSTPSDLGRNGSLPTHPELLDWLATEFNNLRDGHGTGHAGLVASAEQKPNQPQTSKQGTSPKRIHRLIVTSATYRQDSAARPEGMERDSGTRLLWRYPPRRLEAEPLRDAILAVCGNLDDRMGGPGFDLFEPNTNYVKVYNSKREFGPAEWRRMVYQSKPRMQLDDTFGQFDCPDAGQITPKRTSSITALQALNLLNSRFVVQQSVIFSKRIESEAGSALEAQVERAYLLTFLRPPSHSENTMATAFLKEHGLPALCRALLNANEFLFVF